MSWLIKERSHFSLFNFNLDVMNRAKIKLAYRRHRCAQLHPAIERQIVSFA